VTNRRPLTPPYVPFGIRRFGCKQLDFSDHLFRPIHSALLTFCFGFHPLLCQAASFGLAAVIMNSYPLGNSVYAPSTPSLTYPFGRFIRYYGSNWLWMFNHTFQYGLLLGILYRFPVRAHHSDLPR